MRISPGSPVTGTPARGDAWWELINRGSRGRAAREPKASEPQLFHGEENTNGSHSSNARSGVGPPGTRTEADGENPGRPGNAPSPPVNRQRRQATATAHGGKRRRASKDNESTGTIRYFLTKPTSNGTPELGEEMADEHQALLAARKADQSFVTIEEWTAKADRRKGVTVLGKDPVVRH